MAAWLGLSLAAVSAAAAAEGPLQPSCAGRPGAIAVSWSGAALAPSDVVAATLSRTQGRPKHTYLH